MDFYQIITLLFSFLGLMNGLFAAGLFRLKRFYLYGIAGALISCGAVQYLSLIPIFQPTRLRRIPYAAFCFKKKKPTLLLRHPYSVLCF